MIRVFFAECVCRKVISMEINGKQKALALAAHVGWLFLGVGYVLIPLVIYLIYDGKDGFVAGHAKQALLAQFIFGILSVIVAGLTFLVVGVVLWPVLAVIGIVWFCCSILACFKVINGRSYHYPLLG